MAQSVRLRGYIHHFVIGPQGINGAEQFLENVCAQLIGRFRLDRPAQLPPNASRDGAFLNSLLHEASQKLAKDDHVVLLVDALDEAD
jgi:hypothetical protein